MSNKMKLIDGLSNKEYHELNSISSSFVKTLAISPAHAKNSLEVKFEASSAMNLGTVVHSLVLEPENFDNDIIVLPEDAPRKPSKAQINAKKPSPATTEAIEWWDEFNLEAEGKLIISPDEYSKATRIAESVFNHSVAKDLLTNGVAEQSVMFELEGLDCRCRPDYFKGDVVVDLKTAVDASPSGFASAVAKYRYDIQQSFYMSGCEFAKQFIFVVVETKSPYAVGVYELSADDVLSANEKVSKLLHKWKACEDIGHYPAYADHIVKLKLPNWYKD